MYEHYAVMNYISYILVEPFAVHDLTLLLELYLKYYFTKQVVHLLQP